MAETTIEQKQTAEGLENLPQAERDETQKILDEIETEKAQAPTDPKPTEEVKPVEPKKEPVVEPKPEEKKLEDIKPEPRRDTKLIPAWQLEIERDKTAKREKDLLEQIETLKGPAGKKPEDTVASPEDFAKRVSALVDDEGISETLAKRMIELEDIAKNGVKIPKEITEAIEGMKQAKDAASIVAETAQFNQDFDKQILPLIKAEYGDDTKPEIIERIREDLKAKAYSTEYSKVPYTTIYKGEDQFRGVIAEKKKGAEGARGGSTAAQENAGGDQIDLAKPLSDEVVASLSNADFEKYCKNMESYEKSLKKSQ